MDGVKTENIVVVFIVGIIMTVFTVFLKPVINILTLPINIITLGLFSFLINVVLFWALGIFVDGFSVQNFYAGILGSLIVSLVNWIFGKIFKK